MVAIGTVKENLFVATHGERSAQREARRALLVIGVLVRGKHVSFVTSIHKCSILSRSTCKWQTTSCFV
jgi:hypothetical protein